jgi:hypothetical protein
MTWPIHSILYDVDIFVDRSWGSLLCMRRCSAPTAGLSRSATSCALASYNPHSGKLSETDKRMLRLHGRSDW